MSIVDDLRHTLTDFAPSPGKLEELKRLSQFYERMKQEGVAKTREYALPPLDTIGRRAIVHKTRD